jgi:hypothetical protein
VINRTSGRELTEMAKRFQTDRFTFREKEYNGTLYETDETLRERLIKIANWPSGEKIPREIMKQGPTCVCGATTNLRSIAVTMHTAKMTCGSCYQSQRRSEIQAQKLEQARVDLDRSSKERASGLRDPYDWDTGKSGPGWEG